MTGQLLSCSWPLQVAIMTRLRGNVVITVNGASYVVPVVDRPNPATITWPYVALGEEIVTPDPTLERYGEQQMVTFHTWSTYRGRLELKQIEAQIQALLTDDGNPLEIDGFIYDGTIPDMQYYTPDPDPAVQHGVLRIAFYARKE